MTKAIQKIFIIIYFISFLTAYSTERKIGDVLQVALPLTAISSTYYMKDMDGFKSFLKSYMITAGSTYLLKITTHKRRPDGSNYLSFPSGHTSAAFAGASFVHFRYGFKYSIPLYFLASFTGYSRVESKKHYVEDVVAGAGLAILSSWYFTSPYSKKYSFNLNYNQNTKMIKFNFVKLF
tara:strand:+ start:162 stop:698 length:537 start_codon:yes stop_codon:yes gene_type:complete